MQIRLGHSPDPDDAFMFYGLAKGLIDAGPYHVEHILRDIQTLNEWALEGRLEVTAISVHAYPYVADKYAMLECGSSMGDQYGPMIIARDAIDLDRLGEITIAVPGTMTTAFLVLSIMLGKDAFRYEVMPFDTIIQAVADGNVDAGLIIHEGQLTYADAGLTKLVDLGQWWHQQTGLPLPLGGNVIRRDLGEHVGPVAALLERSIKFSLDHRTDALQYALQYARDMDIDLADEFVGMYVNQWTLGYGAKGHQAVRELLQRGHAAGITPDPGEIAFV